MRARKQAVFYFMLMVGIVFPTRTSLSQGYLVHSYTEKDGLANSSVYDALQDSTGRMWFTTRSGISVYDGFEWKSYTVKEGLPGISYSKLSLDETGKIWALSQAPTLRISFFYKGKWVTLQNPIGELTGTTLTAFYVTTKWQGLTILVGTSYHGIYMLRNKKWEWLNEKNGFLSNRINGIHFHEKKFFVNTDKGIAIIDKNGIHNNFMKRIRTADSNVAGMVFEKINEGESVKNRMWMIGKNWIGYVVDDKYVSVMENVRIALDEPFHYLELVPDGNGGVFYGNPIDLCHYHRKTGKIEYLNRESGLVTEGATALLIDREKNLWIASLRGVSKIPSFKFANYSKAHGLFENEVSAIIERKPNSYVFGHSTGVTFYENELMKTLPFDFSGEISKSQIRVLDMDKDSSGNVWLAISRLGLVRIDKNNRIHWYHSNKNVGKHVTSVLVDADENIWVAANKGIFVKKTSDFEPVNIGKLPVTHFRKLELGSNGTIYLATSKHGVYRLQNGEWEMIRHRTDNRFNNVYAIFEDHQGRVWIGTIGGLGTLTGNEIAEFQQIDFRINRPVYLILQDKKNRLWFGTDNGAIRWDGKKTKFYTVNNGFAGQETNRAAGLLDSYGRVWIGADLGVSCYQEEFDKENQKIPAPYVELFNMEVNGSLYNPENASNLHYNENNLVFRFRGISFIDEKRTRFRTKLEGFDIDWSEVRQSYNMEIRYTNLSPGTYQFHLQARNAVGDWSKIVSSEKIMINKPFWKSVWFNLALIFFGTVLIFIIIKINAEYRYSTELKKQVRERTEKLQESETRLKKYNDVLLELSTSKSLAEGNLDKMFQRITEVTAKTNSVKRASVWLYNKERTKIECLDLFVLDKEKHSKGTELSADDFPGYFQALQSERTIAAVNARTDPRTAEFTDSYLKPLGITSILDTQIRISGLGIGVICQEHCGEQRFWSQEEINFGSSMADFVSLTIEANDRKKVKEELEIAKELAEAANKSKSLFLANMSHEIRTPMNGIIGLTDILLETKLSPQQLQYLTMVKNSSAQLLVVLNDILDFSKIEAGQLALETSSFNLREEVESVSDSVIHRLNEKKLEFGILVQNDVPTELVGDAGRLKQVLLNLIGNGIKFTDSGEIIVNVSVEKETEHDAIIRFNVKDTGVGIDPEKQSFIFDCFTQVENTRSAKYGGTGLGLAISSQLVKMMAGEIGVKSEPGKGSEFYFTARFKKQAKSSTEKMVLNNGFRDIKILAVDDNATNRLILSEMLKSFGCQFKITEDGQQFLEILKSSNDYQLLITDYHMPEMDGKKLVHHVINSEKHAHLPIIILTSIDQNEEINGLAESGNVFSISKPIRQSQLFNAIIMALNKVYFQESKQVESEQSDDKVRNILDQIEALNMQKEILLVEDNLVNQAVATSILEMTGLTIDIVEDGQKAVAAIQRKEYALVLMDVKMPNMDGLTATRIIRQELNLTRIPIIAMTAHAMKGDREKCLEAGMNDYISKPIIPFDLYKVIYNWMKKSKVLVANNVNG